jgi:hypothetical protein
VSAARGPVSRAAPRGLSAEDESFLRRMARRPQPFAPDTSIDRARCHRLVGRGFLSAVRLRGEAFLVYTVISHEQRGEP